MLWLEVARAHPPVLLQVRRGGLHLVTVGGMADWTLQDTLFWFRLVSRTYNAAL